MLSAAIAAPSRQYYLSHGFFLPPRTTRTREQHRVNIERDAARLREAP